MSGDGGPASDDDLGLDATFEALLGEVAAAPPQTIHGELRPGARFGELTIKRKLGAGGMGVVYLARDEKLERDVAVKVLRDERRSAAGQERLLREAQAIARIQHPNVITIHGVGTNRDEVFLEMEYVEGETLGAYLRGGRRPLADVLGRFIAAGRGLAAAHAAGLIHRDFKPDNVLLGKDGRVRVTDFGLASTASNPMLAGSPASAAGGWSSGAALTATGALVGTPSYMAPEQARGGDLDASADQFSFCVALYEGLYRAGPFADAEARDAGSVRPPPPGSQVPARLRALVLRGLAGDRTKRHPSMTALLDALADDPARRWRRGAALALALVAVGGATWALAPGARVDPCPSAGARLAGAWDAAAAARVKAAFLASGRPYAADTFARAGAILDGRARAWLATHDDVCRATHVRGERSEHELDLRMHCLDRQLDELKALVQALAAGPDPAVVDHAVSGALSLAPIEACADLDALARGAPSLAPAAQARVDALAARLDVAQALQTTGRYDAALAAIDPLMDDVRAAGDPALLVRGVLLQARIHDDKGDIAGAERSLRVALRAAAEAHDDAREAEAWTRLLTLASKRRDFTAIKALDEAAELRVLRAGGDRLRSALLSAQGAAAYRAGDAAGAEARFAGALALREKEVPPDELDIAGLLDNLAAAIDNQDRLAEAEALERRALAIKERLLGPDHPRVASNLINLGITQRERGEYDDSHRAFVRALRIREVLGPDHPDVANAHLAFSALLRAEGKPEEARGHAELALAGLQKTFGASSQRTITPRRALADSLVTLGQTGAAQAQLEAAIAVGEAERSPYLAQALSDLGDLLALDAPGRAEGLLQRALVLFREQASTTDEAVVEDRLGVLYQQTGRCREAVPLLERALRTYAAAEQTFSAAKALQALGRCQLARGEAARAILFLASAALEAGADSSKATEAWCWFGLAEALWAHDRGQDRPRALALAEKARGQLDDDQRVASRARRKQIDAWLVAHRGRR